MHIISDGAGFKPHQFVCHLCRERFFQFDSFSLYLYITFTWVAAIMILTYNFGRDWKDSLLISRLDIGK